MVDKNGDNFELQTLLGDNEENQNTNGEKLRESSPLNGKSALKVVYCNNNSFVFKMWKVQWLNSDLYLIGFKLPAR